MMLLKYMRFVLNAEVSQFLAAAGGERQAGDAGRNGGVSPTVPKVLPEFYSKVRYHPRITCVAAPTIIVNIIWLLH